jgi:hypothetical protein
LEIRDTADWKSALRALRLRRAVQSAAQINLWLKKSELHLDRFARGLERLQIEGHNDGDFLADDIIGYSP